MNRHVEIETVLSAFWEGQEDASPEAREFTESLVCGVRAALEEVDTKIKAVAEHWDIDRMSALDRNIIRMAVYEMLHLMDIPPVVSINEAVDLAKHFGTSDSGKFVNGILDRICDGLERPAREASSG
jgi:N utilization substance protein B